MPNTTIPKKNVEVREGVYSHAGITCAFEQIEHPGCYVSVTTGQLVRVPPEALAFGRSPLIEIVGQEPWIVTKITDDPYTPLGKARMGAADLDLTVNF